MPYVMDFDPHSGDFGLGFFGHCLESGAYYVLNETMGELCYLCDVAPTTSDSTETEPAAAGVTITPRDSFHSRVFLGAHRPCNPQPPAPAIPHPLAVASCVAEAVCGGVLLQNRSRCTCTPRQAPSLTLTLIWLGRPLWWCSTRWFTRT